MRIGESWIAVSIFDRSRYAVVGVGLCGALTLYISLSLYCTPSITHLCDLSRYTSGTCGAAVYRGAGQFAGQNVFTSRTLRSRAIVLQLAFGNARVRFGATAVDLRCSVHALHGPLA